MKMQISVHDRNLVLLKPKLFSGFDYIDVNGYFVGYPYLGSISVRGLYYDRKN